MLKMKCFLFIIVVMLLCSTGTFSQRRPNRGRAPRFSSVYTDMKTECWNSTWEMGGGGEREKVIKCKGYGGYWIYINKDDSSSWIWVMGNAFGNISPLQPLGYWSDKGIKLEWRLADGQPFALIFRAAEYKPDKPRNEMKGVETPYDEKYKTGEFLFVMGLGAVELKKIDYKVDVKTPNANERARELADSAFLTIPPLAERKATAARAWPSFFNAFRSAVKRRDRAALKQMLASSFSIGRGEIEHDMAFEEWDRPEVRGWEAFDKVLAQGAAPLGPWYYDGSAGEYIQRVAPPSANIRKKFDQLKWYALFSFSEGRWKCDSFFECCAPDDNHSARNTNRRLKKK